MIARLIELSDRFTPVVSAPIERIEAAAVRLRQREDCPDWDEVRAELYGVDLQDETVGSRAQVGNGVWRQ